MTPTMNPHADRTLEFSGSIKIIVSVQTSIGLRQTRPNKNPSIDFVELSCAKNTH